MNHRRYIVPYMRWYHSPAQVIIATWRAADCRWNYGVIAPGNQLILIRCAKHHPYVNVPRFCVLRASFDCKYVQYTLIRNKYFAWTANLPPPVLPPLAYSVEDDPQGGYRAVQNRKIENKKTVRYCKFMTKMVEYCQVRHKDKNITFTSKI